MATLSTDQLADVRADTGLKSQYIITITGKPTGGSFTLTYNAQTTAAIAYNATAAVVQAALEALSTIDLGGCTVTGIGIAKDSVGSPYNVVFARDEGRVLTATAAGLTGGTSPAVAIATQMAFSNVELQRLYARAEVDVANGVTDDTYGLTVYLALWQMLADRAKFHNYTVNQDAQNKQQLFTNTKDLLEIWTERLGLDDGESIGSGTLSLHVDTDCDDLTTWQNQTEWCI